MRSSIKNALRKTKKMSDHRKSFTYNITATVCGWLALFFCVFSVSVHYWLTDGQNWSAGLWSVCSQTKCVSYVEYPALYNEAWFQAVRAMMVLCSLLTFFGCVFNIISQVKRSKPIRFASGGIFSVATIIAMISASVFSSKAPNGYRAITSSTLHNGYGFIFAWLTKVLLLAAGAANNRSAAKMTTKKPVNNIVVRDIKVKSTTAITLDVSVNKTIPG